MPETDLHQLDLGPVRAAAEAAELAHAASRLVSAYGYRLVTGHRDQGAQR
jgi:hypothetical protein